MSELTENIFYTFSGHGWVERKAKCELIESNRARKRMEAETAAKAVSANTSLVSGDSSMRHE